MIDEPLDFWQLRELATRKAWKEFAGDNVSGGFIPEGFHKAVDVVIRETYGNLDKMIGKTIKLRLEHLYNDE